MRNYQDIVLLFDLVGDYYTSIKLELERGGFGAQLFENENKLLDHFISYPGCYKCDWASNLHLTQKVADLFGGCFDYITTNEDRVIKRTNHYLTILEQLDKCLTDIEFTTGICPTAQAQPQQEPSTEAIQLPQELDTAEARRYFARAVEAGYMVTTGAQVKWVKAQAMLGYLCLKVFEQPRPITAIEQYFGVKNLAASITQASYEPKRSDVKKWRAEIDKKIFFD